MSMYNLIEHSSQFSSKDEATNFNADIVKDNYFKSFEYKAKLLGNAVAQADNAANGILRNATIALQLKYLSNLWRSLEMPLINCKVELKLRWTKHCVLSPAGNDNANCNDDNIIFTIKDTKLYLPVVTLSARDNQKLSKLSSKEFERSVYWNQYKTKGDNKNMKSEFRYFLKLNFIGVNRLFVSAFSNEDDASKRYYLPKGTINKYNIISNGKNFYDQPVSSDKN